MWVKKKPKLKITELFDYEGSPVVSHSIKCWLCDKNPAVYSGYPDFCFLPCWECQEKTEGIWNRDIWNKKWYQFWK